VPVAENTAVLAERYRALGGRIEVILKPGVGHHPHSLEDPAPAGLEPAAQAPACQGREEAARLA